MILAYNKQFMLLIDYIKHDYITVNKLWSFYYEHMLAFVVYMF